MKILKLRRGGVEPHDGYRRLGVFQPIGHAARVGKIVTVNLHQNHAPPRDLAFDVAFDAVIERQLLYAQPKQALQIGERRLEKGELVALEILGTVNPSIASGSKPADAISSIHKST